MHAIFSTSIIIVRMASLRLRKAACSAVSSADTARTDKHHVSCTIHSLSRALVHASTRKNKRARTARVPQTQTNFGCKQHLVKAHVWSGHDFAWRLSARLRLEYHSTGTCASQDRHTFTIALFCLYAAKWRALFLLPSESASMFACHQK